MNYLEFLLCFIVIPLVVLSVWACKKKCLDRKTILDIGLLCAIALVYTTPWDNYLIMENIWSYADGAILGTFGYVPVEEYGFMVMQTMLAGILWSLVSKRLPVFRLSFSGRGFLVGLIPGLIGAFLLSSESGTYAGLILVWASLPLAVQWGFGERVLRQGVKIWMPLWAIFTLYLCVADAYAISEGIWEITLATRSGIEIGNLPIEEALFFALTNLFVLQGLCLWHGWARQAG